MASMLLRSPCHHFAINLLTTKYTGCLSIILKTARDDNNNKLSWICCTQSRYRQNPRGFPHKLPITTARCKNPGGGTLRKIGWGCAARFPKPLPYLWPISAIFPTLFMTSVLSVWFEVGVSLLLAPAGADKWVPKAPFPLVENAGIQRAIRKRVLLKALDLTKNSKLYFWPDS